MVLYHFTLWLKTSLKCFFFLFNKPRLRGTSQPALPRQVSAGGSRLAGGAGLDKSQQSRAMRLTQQSHASDEWQPGP